MISPQSVTGYRSSMRQVFNVFAALFIAIGLVFTTGCKEKGMDLPPEGYFTGQQLVLAKAIRDGNIGNIKRLAKETDLNSPGEHDMTLLFYALATSTHDNATPERLQIATELVKAGADPLQPRPNGGASPAEWMAKLDNGIWLKALLDGGLSPNARGKLDDLPIIFQTIKSSNTETMATLIKYGADINIQDRLKRTPLVECAYLGRIDHMNLLLKHGANPFIEDRFGENFVDLLDDKIKKTEGNDSLHTRYLELKKLLRVQ